MSVLEELSYCEPQKAKPNPVHHRRLVMKRGLEKQIDLLSRDDLTGISGKKAWWKNTDNGVVASVRFASTKLKLHGEQTDFRLETEEELKKLYEQMVKEVESGGWDERITEHWQHSNFNPNRIPSSDSSDFPSTEAA